ncbi:hypothetical protein, partial [Roseinatronobacter bogoriensis]|uniref:hypothetical protein n=1 Tax=Roseinatronobacter bogoriensis TaxID=119542 RepID=UPI001B3C1696
SLGRIFAANPQAITSHSAKHVANIGKWRTQEVCAYLSKSTACAGNSARTRARLINSLRAILETYVLQLSLQRAHRSRTEGTVIIRAE